MGMRHCFTMSDYFEILGKLAVGKRANTGSTAVFDCESWVCHWVIRFVISLRILLLSGCI